MDKVAFATYRDDLLPALVAFWNREFSAKRNFVPMTAELFRQRVAEKKNALERFDPAGLILAVGEDNAVVGMIHAGVNPEEFCRVCVPDWPGGTRGYIALIAVAAARQKQGIGSELWRKALGCLKGSREVVLDGQCLNPFYGNSEGPFTPFWGTTEGISIEWDNRPLRSFLEHHGFLPRYKGISLSLDLVAWDSARNAEEGAESKEHGARSEEHGEEPSRDREGAVMEPRAKSLEHREEQSRDREGAVMEPRARSLEHREEQSRDREGAVEPRARSLECGEESSHEREQGERGIRSDNGASRISFGITYDHYPIIGQPLEFAMRHPEAMKYTCATASDDEVVVGFACGFPMAEVAAGKFGIYELAVAGEYHRHGLGRALLRRLLLSLKEQGGKEVEVVTLPDLSPGALGLYESAGFRPVAEWAVY